MDKNRLSVNRIFIYLAILVVVILLHIYFSFALLGVCIMNSGISFGIGANQFGGLFTTLIVMNLIIFIGIGHLVIKNFIERNVLDVYLYLTLLVFGLLNFIDRLRFGAVCDYITVLGLHFNIPDVIIVIVSVLLILQIFYKNYRSHG